MVWTMLLKMFAAETTTTAVLIPTHDDTGTFSFFSKNPATRLPNIFRVSDGGHLTIRLPLDTKKFRSDIKARRSQGSFISNI